MENFAQDLLFDHSQDLLNIRISGHELPFPNPRNPFVEAGASATDFGEIPPLPFSNPSAFPDPDMGEVPHAPFPNPFDQAGAASTDSLCLKSWENAIDGGVDKLEESCRFFPLSTILKATNDFDDALVVGIGGFGKVYKAIIDDGTVVAIKRLNAESNQGAEEFWTEVKLLSKLRHAHLVSLVGYCNEHQEMILVYEYMAYGTLASHLYKSSREGSGKGLSPLTWAQRLNICLGAARGLDYLHTGTKQPIIHRDVKTTNILLDENWVAKVSDFGICKLITSQTTTHVSTKVKATRGYWDPDYIYTNRVTRKSDVYAFGVVLLEVLCGRPPLDHRLEEEQISLILWVKDRIENGKLDRIIDPSLNGEITPQSLKYFSKLANNCLHTKPKERPTMSEVVEILQNALELHEHKERSWRTITKAFQGIKLVPMGMNRWWREGNGNGSNDGGELPKKSFPQPIFDDVTHSVDPHFSLAEIHAGTNNFNKSLLKEYSNVDVFTYKEMRLATMHFQPAIVLGEGGFGIVYKGVIDESVRPGYETTNVAIKVLAPQGFQGDRE
ncbi:probable serine/threonine-protein kinase PBL22 [Rhododendron vialii]|uniref:probable serine/threonine-protein kinase PBL22 n=1 Tax=Rhododendron vialii TaxID=182163 RepID=UPI00265D7116|nr:probable serine/threonine-protein kinase PBL22 [Rhododendron vialii]